MTLSPTKASPVLKRTSLKRSSPSTKQPKRKTVKVVSFGITDVPYFENNIDEKKHSSITDVVYVELDLPDVTKPSIPSIDTHFSEVQKILHSSEIVKFQENLHEIEDKGVLTLSIRDMYKSFGKKQAVNGVSFDMHTGEVVGFLGPNGAGKTTVFYMIVGFLTPDYGSILFNNVNIEKLPMYKRARMGISYLPQDPSVFRRLSVEKNIIAVLQTIRGMSHEKKKERLEKLISEFGLSEFRKQKAYTLSGGERRRTEIARGMALYPYFLLLDEPFTGIDPKARYELKQIIASLSKKGVGVLITDHNERDTLSITDRAFIIHEGQIVASGSRSEIMNNVRAREIYLGEEYD